MATAVVVVPFFLRGWLPLTDVPEHAAAMASLAHWNDPAFRIAEHYVIGWTSSQYLLVHMLGAGLTRAFGDAELACRMLLVASAIGWIQSSRALLRAFRLDERLAILSATLFWNRAVMIGFLPYVASLPLFVGTLAAFVPLSRAPRAEPPFARRSLALAAAAIVVFYAHASAFTLLTSTAAALALTQAFHRARTSEARARATVVLRDAAVRLAWLVPSGILAAVWLGRGRFAMNGASIHESAEIGTMAPSRALKLIALFAHDTWTSHLDDWVGVGFWLLFAILLFTGERSYAGDERVREARRGSLVPFLVALAVYLATPFRVGTGLLLNVRMAPVLGFFALCGLRPARGLRGSAPIVASLALVLLQCVDNVQQVRKLQADVVGLPELLERVPTGARLLTLNFSGFDAAAAHFTPWLHVGSYHRAYRGGVASFSFSELSHWSVQYRPERAPPRQAELSWGMRACLFRNARDGAYFDYVLVRGALDPFESAPSGPRWDVAGTTSKYTLYAKDSSAVLTPGSDETDDGPCAARAPGDAAAARRPPE